MNTKTKTKARTKLARPDLVCPAGTPAGLELAVDSGADCVYCGFQNATNARNFPGLNFTPAELERSIAYAHARGTKVLVALNTFPPAGEFDLWKQAVDDGARLGVDAFIIADISVAEYAMNHAPEQRLHLSVQAGASSPDAIRFYCKEFGVKRVVLPRILTVPEISEISSQIPCEVEAFIFGNIGMMAEGRCSLSSYATSCSTNMDGVCSPASHVHYKETESGQLHTMLGEFVIDRFERDEPAGYPTICKGRYCTAARPDTPYNAFEEPVTLNLAGLLPDMIAAGVSAFKIEGRQRGKAYVQMVVSGFRKAVDDCMAGRTPDLAHLIALSEGRRETEGPFKSKTWR